MRSWSLNKKIWSVLGLLILTFIGSIYFALNRMNAVKEDLNQVGSVFIKRDQLTSAILDNQRRMVLLSFERILETDEIKMSEMKQSFNGLLAKQEVDIKTYKSVASAQGIELVQSYEADFNKWLLEYRRSEELASKNLNDEAYKVLAAAKPLRISTTATLSEMSDMTAKRLNEKIANSNDMAQAAAIMTFATSAIAILIAIVIAYFVLRAVTLSINNVVRSLHDSSAQVSSAAGQIASASEELSQATTEQAASLQQTSASIEEMNAMVAKNSENAVNTAETSHSSKEKALHGKQVVEDMIRSMDAISTSNETIMKQINHSNEQFSNIAKVIEEIGNKTKVINDIVFQTKLLSFNASVEAARAGEHGKGFAVVAEEVGNLAQMSGNAAKEISSMLEESIKSVHGIVHETKQTVGKLAEEGRVVVENGSRVARECGEVLEGIVNNVGSVANMADEIAKASEEQSRGISEITRAVNQLDQATQQNAATSEEAASSAEELSAQAVSLQSAVFELVLTVRGDDGSKSNGHTTGHSAPLSGKPVQKSPGKVIALKKEPKGEQMPMSKASGDSTAPSPNDPRFKDI